MVIVLPVWMFLTGPPFLKLNLAGIALLVFIAGRSHVTPGLCRGFLYTGFSSSESESESKSETLLGSVGSVLSLSAFSLSITLKDSTASLSILALAARPAALVLLREACWC